MSDFLTKDEQSSKFEISESARSYLKQTTTWTLFFSVLGFIFIGLTFIAAIALPIVFSALENGNMPAISGTVLGGVYFVMGLIYVFPVIYLYRFSTKMRSALDNSNGTNFDIALKNFKSHFKFMGIFTIAFVGIYILVAVMLVFSGLLTTFWQY